MFSPNHKSKRLRSNTSQEIIDLTETCIIGNENSFNEASVESKIENISKRDANDAADNDDDEESLEESFREEGILIL